MKKHRRQNKKQLVVNSIGVAAALLSTSADAQNTTTLNEVVVTGQQEQVQSFKSEASSSVKFTQPLVDTPQTVVVVPQSVIQSQGAATLRDVLRNVSGISMQAGEGGTPAGDQMSIRGFSSRTDIFVDGVRDFGGYSRDPFNTQQVEVIKGPASAQTGRGSTGGSINQISKTPYLDTLSQASVGYGTSDYKRITFDVNQAIEKIEGAAVRLNGLWHDQDIAGRDVVDNKRWGFAPAVSFGLETPTQTTISYFHLEQDNIPDYGIPWVPLGNTAFPQYTEQPSPADWSNFYGLHDRDYEKVKTDILSLEVKHVFNDDFSMRNLTRFGRNDRDSLITAPRFADLNAVVVGVQSAEYVQRGDWKSRDQISTIWANQTDFTAKFDTGDIGHTLVSGIEFAREGDENQTRAQTGTADQITSIYEPDYDDPYTSNIQRTGLKTAVDANSMAVYAFDTAKLNKWWELLGGLRWDRFSVDFHPPVGGQSLDRADDKLTWRTGVIYKPVEEGSIYGAYGTSFNPSAEGLALSTLTNNAANVDVAPEESQTFELGTKWELFKKRLSLSLAAFRTDKTNARTEDSTSTTDFIVLDGKQRVDGIEVGASGEVTRNWHLFAGYTFLKSKIVKSNTASEMGNELSNTPQSSFNLWTTYDLPMNFQIGGGLQFVDRRFNSNTNTREAPDYWLGDAMVAYNVNENISLRLNVYNLADEEYISNVGGGHFIPGTGRTAVLSTNFKF